MFESFSAIEIIIIGDENLKNKLKKSKFCKISAIAGGQVCRESVFYRGVFLRVSLISLQDSAHSSIVTIHEEEKLTS